jgi:protein-S-isoprenylcysteine O-methyltransferase Ste14
MNQEARNKLYLAIVAVIGLAVTFGLIDQATATVWVAMASDILTGVFAVSAAIGVFIAWWKSRPKTTTVIDVPKAEVELVITSPELPNVDANSQPVLTE